MSSGSGQESSAGSELCHHIAADGRSLADARGVLSAWASTVGMPENQRGDLVLATYEAMANAAEHGYGGRGGVITLRAHRAADEVVVTVVDHGAWRPQPTDKGNRGRGLPMIEALADRSVVLPTTTGTTVVMTWALSTPAAPGA